MKNKFILLLTLLSILFIPLVSSMGQCDGTFLGTFKSGTEISLRQTCDTCTYVTLSSVVYPNSTTESINKNMTKTGIDYNYSVYTLDNGFGYYSVFGDKDGTIATENFCFEVTPMGESNSMVFFILIYVLFYGITIVGLLKKHEWITLGGCFGLLIIGVYTGISGMDVYKSGLTDAISYITILIGLGLGFESLKEITYY